MNKKVYQLATEITYAQDKSIEISVDDWADKIETLLKEAHDTEDGYCCACEADLAFFHSQLKEREEGYRAEILKEVEEKGSGMALLQGMKVKESPLIPEGEIWISKKI